MQNNQNKQKHTPKKASKAANTKLNAKKTKQESRKVDIVPPYITADILPAPKQTISYFKSTYNSKLKEKQEQSPLKNQQINMNTILPSDRLHKMKQMLTDISHHQLKMKEFLGNIKSKDKNEMNQIENCTFVPQIRKNHRYNISTTLEDRNKSWDDVRAQHFTSIRQQLVESEFKECTFNPNMVAFSRSKRILKNKQIREERAKQLNLRRLQKNSANPEKLVGIEKRAEGVDLRKIKCLLKLEMSKIELDY